MKRRVLGYYNFHLKEFYPNRMYKYTDIICCCSTRFSWRIFL